MSDKGPGETGESVGRYVRERWGAAESPRPRRRSRRADDADPPRAGSGSSAESDDATGAPTATGTRTPPGGNAWGADLPDADDELASEIDPSTPPHGMDLSALRGTGPRHGVPDQATRDDVDDARNGSERRNGSDGHEHHDDDGGYDEGYDEAITRPHAVYTPSNGRRAAPAPAVDEEPPAANGYDDAGSGPRAAADRTAAAADVDRTAADRTGVDRTAADRTGVDRTAADGTGVDRTAADRTAVDRTAADRTGVDRTPSGRAPAEEAPAAPAADAREPEPPVAERGGPASRTSADPDLPPPRAARAGRPRWTAPDAVDAREAQRRRAEEEDPGLQFGTPLMARNAKRPPRSGWRRVVYVLTRGYLNPGESPADIRHRELTIRVNKPLLNSHKIAMLSLKGGVGKTTVTATLGSTFASLRGDRVVAVDANPDRGTLSQKIPLETTATVRHLLRDAQRVRRYTDVRAYTSQGASRLEVLASEQDPAVSEAFSEDDYRNAVDLLEHFYNLVLTDCGTGLMHSAMYGVLGMADQLVIVSSGSIDGARSASATLDWLDAHGNGDLVRNAVVVINTVHRRAGSGVDLHRVAEHFAGRCRAVVQVPFDGHLEEGAEIDLDRLEPGTRTALLELAAAVADGFPS